ncbi:acyltransferase domain-containing protein [Micromonospora sp. BRA006-A]|nr:acyltransferase domain-containing protein [Micromonospora sp. BRA006-A]
MAGGGPAGARRSLVVRHQRHQRPRDRRVGRRGAAAGRRIRAAAGGALPWLLSARTPQALAGQARRLREHLAARPDQRPSTWRGRWPPAGAPSTPERCWWPRPRSGSPTPSTRSSRAGPTRRSRAASAAHRPVRLRLPGQGSQWLGMGLDLLDQAPVFAERMAACDAALRPYLDWSLLDVLRQAPGAPGLDEVDVVQPALFAMMVSLAELWRSYGVQPAAVVGHSQGEIAAACVAGVLSCPTRPGWWHRAAARCGLWPGTGRWPPSRCRPTRSATGSPASVSGSRSPP